MYFYKWKCRYLFGTERPWRKGRKRHFVWVLQWFCKSHLTAWNLHNPKSRVTNTLCQSMELASIAAVCNSAVSPKLYKFIFCPSVFLFLSVFWYADCFPTFFCVITELSVSVTTVYLQWHSGYLVLTLRDRFLCKLLWGRRRLQNYIKFTYQFCGWGLTFINLPVLQGPASVQAAAWAVTHSHVNKFFPIPHYLVRL